MRLACPSCGEHLRVRPAYMAAVFVASLTAYILGLVGAGVGGQALFWAILVAPIIILFAAHLTVPVAALLFPPSLERDSPARTRLFGPPDL